MDTQEIRTAVAAGKISKQKTEKVLTFFNTMDSTDEIENILVNSGYKKDGFGKKLLDKRTVLGGFKNLKQVSETLKMSDESFNALLSPIAGMKGMDTRYEIEGRVILPEKSEHEKEKYTVCAYVNDIEFARDEVTGSGSYKLLFENKENPPKIDIRLLPSSLSYPSANAIALSKTVFSGNYSKKEGIFKSRLDLIVNKVQLQDWARYTWFYHMKGAARAATYVNGQIISAPGVPGLKMDFYEVDILRPWVYRRPVHLGTAYTDSDGNYSFEFTFGLPFIAQTEYPWLLPDSKPDVRVYIRQFVNGSWHTVFISGTDWDISDPYYRDYFIPRENLFPVAPASVKPDTGFKFTYLGGGIPVDDSHFEDGYVTTFNNDPFPGIDNQPLCGILKIHGLFASVLQVASYKVQIAPIGVNPLLLNWQDVLDPISNAKWDEAAKKWVPKSISPDANGFYQNIDTEPEDDWLMHALKVQWNSANHIDGLYALQIIGYDANGIKTGPFRMPDIRIDNTLPDIAVDAVDATQICGDLVLPGNRIINFSVRAYQQNGHLLKYALSGSRGKKAESAGAPKTMDRDHAQGVSGGRWIGGYSIMEPFTVSNRSGQTIQCATMAYNFELTAWGQATDGVTKLPQYRRVETNLVVTEPSP